MTSTDVFRTTEYLIQKNFTTYKFDKTFFIRNCGYFPKYFYGLSISSNVSISYSHFKNVWSNS